MDDLKTGEATDELELQEDIENSLVVGHQYGKLAPTISNEDLKKQLEVETERRAILKTFIKEHLVRGIDYGPILIGGRWSKDMLFKSGQEKFLSLMHFMCDFRIDQETMEAFGNQSGILAYVCIIYDFNGRFVANGRGAATEKDGDPNRVIKMAQKRAQADAINRSGILADFFSVLEDKGGIAPQPTKPVATNLTASEKWCETCASPGPYHAKVCPSFVDPINTSPGDVPAVTDEDMEKIDQGITKNAIK